MKKRVGDPWIPAAAYGALLPQFTVNLLVRDMERALDFYRRVLLAHVHYSDPDFAALRILSTEMMLHTDHAYDQNPWWPRLKDGTTRGLGAELRLLDVFDAPNVAKLSTKIEETLTNQLAGMSEAEVEAALAAK